MIQPNLQPPDGLAREIGRSALPFGIRLAPPDQRNPSSIRMEIYILHFQRHQLAPPSERFVSHAEHRPLAIGPKANAGALDKFFYFLPPERMRLGLSRRGLPPHFL